jgi:hypothetical protein
MGPIPPIILLCKLSSNFAWTRELPRRSPGTYFTVLYDNEGQFLERMPLIVFEPIKDLGPERHEAPVRFVGPQGSTQPIRGKHYDIDLD